MACGISSAAVVDDQIYLMDAGAVKSLEAIAYAKSKQPAYDSANEANTLAQRGSSLRALAKIDQAIAMEPNEARFHGLKGDLLRAGGRYQEALAQYSRALQLDDSYHSYYLVVRFQNAICH